MEFWSAEVKSGEVSKIVPGEGMVVHLSQASLGEMKKEKGNESVCLFVNVDGKKLVLGTLFSDKLPQQQFDLVFDQNFEISHNWKNGSVYFIGYKASNPFDDEGFPEGDSDESESESEEEDIPNTLATNGKPVSKSKPGKPEESKAVAAKGKDSTAGKQKVQIVEPPKDVKPKDDDDDSDDDMMSDDDDGESEDEDDEDDSDESDESDEETPKKVEPSKKRPTESKTPVSDKKAKVTPQKTDDKKGGVHVATPYPKQASKTPANKPNQQTPKGAGSSHTCKTCSRTFGSDKALESHSKAKHG